MADYLGVIIGGSIAFLSAFFMDYFRSRKQEKDVINNDIKKMYLDESIVPVRNELSYFGNITLKVVNQARRDFHTLSNTKELRDYIMNIKSRSDVQKVVGYEFAQAHAGVIHLYKLGDKIPWAIQYAFWWYSAFLGDLLNEKRMQEFLEEDKSKELQESLMYLTQLLQSLRIWLEKKLFKLESLLREKKYGSYEDFEKTIKSEEVAKVVDEISALHKVYRNEEERRDKGEKWGQEMINYINAHP